MYMYICTVYLYMHVCVYDTHMCFIMVIYKHNCSNNSNCNHANTLRKLYSSPNIYQCDSAVSKCRVEFPNTV